MVGDTEVYVQVMIVIFLCSEPLHPDIMLLHASNTVCFVGVLMLGTWMSGETVDISINHQDRDEMISIIIAKYIKLTI